MFGASLQPGKDISRRFFSSKYTWFAHINESLAKKCVQKSKKKPAKNAVSAGRQSRYGKQVHQRLQKCPLSHLICPCSFCLLPVVNTSQGPQQAESLHPPGFWFWFYFLFHFIFSFHPLWFYIFIWITSRIESFQTLSSFLMDAMSLEMRRT